LKTHAKSCSNAALCNKWKRKVDLPEQSGEPWGQCINFSIPLYFCPQKLDSEYFVKKYPAPLEAKIFQNGIEIAELKKNDASGFTLTKYDDGKEWILANSVHGQRRPFSLSIRESGNAGRGDAASGKGAKRHPHHDYNEHASSHTGDVLTVKNHVFKHGGKFYMLRNHPEGSAPKSYLSGPRYISRLDNFPHSELSEVGKHDSHGGSHRLKRFRGVPVGEASGLGIAGSGHRVKVGEELRDIGLLLAASSYLLYASA